MARPPQAPNMDVFDAYFRRADLDQDGRISGNEAVAFFQGSNLSKQVLAQIWMHADQNRTGFLGRAEFYNALRLVTVAQSGRELTPDIVKAALFGPAAAKIPAPQISPAPAVTPQMGAVASPVMNSIAPTALQMNAVTQPVPYLNSGLQVMPQNPGFRGPQQQNILMNQQFPQTLDKQFTKPPSAQIPPSPTQGINQGGLPGAVTGPRPPISNASAVWLGAKMGSTSMGAGTQVFNRGIVASSASLDLVGQGSSVAASSISSKPSIDTTLSTLQPLTKDPKVHVSGNGLSMDSMFGGDAFSATPSQPRQEIVPSTTFAVTNISSSSAIVPVTSSGAQSSLKQGPDTTQGFLGKATAGEHLQRTSSLVKPNQFGAPQAAPAVTGSGVPVGFAGPATSQVQHPWPSMTQSDIQRYNAIFIEVDTDRDGKITGEQARNLFLSWRLPREVLKQVWDLSDQDNDSMLSLKEFCVALYLMERYREGRPLPSVLPSSLKFDEALLPPVSQQASMFGGTSWRPQHGFHQQMPSGTHSPGLQAGIKSVQDRQMPLGDVARVGQPLPQKSRGLVSEKHLVNQLNLEEQHLNSKLQEATNSEKKVEGLEKEILDSKEKIEYYRTKMQELVLYKSRCDNRLNEITERASADRNEVESLAKKYEEKYKQVGEIASKLAVEDATFRDIQERKLELFNAIVKMEQGGSADGLLQVRVDRIQSDLEGLVKALNDRCKHHGLQLKATALVELPYGWQPGIQIGAVEWDDDWDKFEDEGFTVVQELTVEAEKVPSAKPKPPSVWNEKTVSRDAFSVESSSNIDNSVDKPSITGEHVAEGGSPHAQNEYEFTNGGPVSPAKSGRGSPPRELPPAQFDKGISLDSFASFKESQSEHAVSEPSHSDQKFDEPSWGATFSDTNDDVDSVWGFNAVSSKDSGLEKHIDPFFGADDMGLNPIRTGSPSANSLFWNKDKSPFFFGDSVPASPMFNSNSPNFSTGSDDHQFGSTFLKFDAFSIHDNASPRHDATLTRFDSIRSSRDFDHARGFSFDDTDPFGSTGPFKSDNSVPQRTSDSWRAF
ncbi:uncharacterized protein LOC116247775 isoform X1 [Nymphaea colorata]|nr:uncharacterized protein LOC116247775 isoform X1 [Nymphaea colorata]